MRTATRDVQTCSHNLQLLHDIAIKISTTNKRLYLIESHTSSISKRSIAPSSDPATRTRQPPSSSAHQSNSASYWRESTNTLSRENTNLTSRITHAEADNAKLRDTINRMTIAKKEAERSLHDTTKEIMHLSFIARHQCTPARLPTRIRMDPVPASTLGKDAMYWYQTCRTMEAQFIEEKAALETKIAELTDVAASVKRKRGSATNQS